MSRSKRPPVATPWEGAVRVVSPVVLAVSLTLVVVVLLFYCLLSTIGGNLWMPTSLVWLYRISLVLVMAVPLAVVLPPMLHRRGRAAVLRARFRICPGCRYLLAGLPERGECPECGRAYSVESLREG